MEPLGLAVSIFAIAAAPRLQASLASLHSPRLATPQVVFSEMSREGAGRRQQPCTSLHQHLSLPTFFQEKSLWASYDKHLENKT